MITCPKCGAATQAGKFCGQCGAPLDTSTATPSGQLAPSSFGAQPQPPQPPQASSPVYGGQTPPMPPHGQPPTYPPVPPQGQFPAYPPTPPRKSGSKVGLWIGVIVGVLLLGFVGLVALLPDEVPADDPAPPPSQTGQNTPPAQNNPPAQKSPPAQPTQPAAPAPKPNELGVTKLAQGHLDAQFDAFDWHSAGMVSLAVGDGSSAQLTLYDFINGDFKPAFQFIEPMGALRDVVFGQIYNDGKYRAIMITEKGLLVVDSEGESFTVDATDVNRVYVGDWDGDGQEETAIFMTVDGEPVTVVSRYYLEKETERVGLWEVNEFPEWPAQTFLTVNKRRMLMGVNEVDTNTKEVVLYTIDPATGLERYLSQNVESMWSAPLIGAGAGMLGGKPTLVLTYQGSPSYIELFDIGQSGFTSRGQMNLPDGDAYYPIVGLYSGDELEVLAMTPEGKWILYGF